MKESIICDRCNGTGEGVSCESCSCHYCKGTGEIEVEICSNCFCEYGKAIKKISSDDICEYCYEASQNED